MLCRGVKNTFIDSSTGLTHLCTQYVCVQGDPFNSPKDCKILCPEYYRCLLEKFQTTIAPTSITAPSLSDQTTEESPNINITIISLAVVVALTIIVVLSVSIYCYIIKVKRRLGISLSLAEVSTMLATLHPSQPETHVGESTIQAETSFNSPASFYEPYTLTGASEVIMIHNEPSPLPESLNQPHSEPTSIPVQESQVGEQVFVHINRPQVSQTSRGPLPVHYADSVFYQLPRPPEDSQPSARPPLDSQPGASQLTQSTHQTNARAFLTSDLPEFTEHVNSLALPSISSRISQEAGDQASHPTPGISQEHGPSVSPQSIFFYSPADLRQQYSPTSVPFVYAPSRINTPFHSYQGHRQPLYYEPPRRFYSDILGDPFGRSRRAFFVPSELIIPRHSLPSIVPGNADLTIPKSHSQGAAEAEHSQHTSHDMLWNPPAWRESSESRLPQHTLPFVDLNDPQQHFNVQHSHGMHMGRSRHASLEMPNPRARQFFRSISQPAERERIRDISDVDGQSRSMDVRKNTYSHLAEPAESAISETDENFGSDESLATRRPGLYVVQRDIPLDPFENGMDEKYISSPDYGITLKNVDSSPSTHTATPTEVIIPDVMASVSREASEEPVEYSLSQDDAFANVESPMISSSEVGAVRRRSDDDDFLKELEVQGLLSNISPRNQSPVESESHLSDSLSASQTEESLQMTSMEMHQNPQLSELRRESHTPLLSSQEHTYQYGSRSTYLLALQTTPAHVEDLFAEHNSVEDERSPSEPREFLYESSQSDEESDEESQIDCRKTLLKQDKENG